MSAIVCGGKPTARDLRVIEAFGRFLTDPDSVCRLCLDQGESDGCELCARIAEPTN